MKSSGDSQPSDFSRAARRSASDLAIVLCALVAIVSLAAWWCFRNGYILYYGDAEAHLNTSRALIDSRTPGYDQIGTVWLPVLHIICLPFVANDWLWSTGLAGTLPVAFCFVLAGFCFYLTALESYRNTAAAASAVACFALNPNVLYLAAIPMTEIVFMAGLFITLLAILRFRATQSCRWIAIAIASSWAIGLTRYDGWFLIPFIAAWLAANARHNRLTVFFLFAAFASFAPAYWVAHNWWEKGYALDFYNGPYSAKAIQGGHPYPGYRDWIAAVHYYSKAGELCAGGTLLLLGFVGAICACKRHALQPVLFLSLTPLFYIWSMHSSGGSPIYLPSLSPHSYYNSRYGIALVPLCAFAAGAIALVLPARFRRFAFFIPLLAASPWLLHPTKETWICWKESQINSVDRRAWTKEGARFLNAHYHRGGILTSQGDVTGIYRQLRIHLSETINIGNGPLWMEATTRPDLFHPTAWTVYQTGDSLAKSLANYPSAIAEPVLVVTTSKFSPDLNIFKRNTHARDSLH